MNIDEDLPRRRADALDALLREDLDLLSVAELDARIAALKQEIVRAEAKMSLARDHMASADALFRKS